MATGIEAYGYPQPPAQAPQGTIWGGGSAGGGQYSTGGGSFGVGVRPSPYSTPGYQAGPIGGSLTTPGGMGQQFPWQGMYQADQQGQRAIGQGLDALMSGLSVSSPFGQQVGSLFSNPQGLPPHLLAQQQRMLSETAAGSRANQQRNLEGKLTSNGFANSPAAAFASSQIDARSAADLNDAQQKLAIQDALMAMQRQGQMGGIMAQLYGTDAGLRGQYAGIQAGRQFPIYPGNPQTGAPWGGMGGGAQPVNTGPWWSQGGQYQTGQMPYDPFTPQGGGYSPQNPWKPF